MKSLLQNAIGLFQAGRLSEAAAACEEMLAPPGNPVARLLAGQIAAAQGNRDQALIHFRLLGGNPDTPVEIQYRAAAFLAELGDLEAAAAALRHAARGGAFSVLFELGVLEERLGNVDAALASYSAAIAANSGDARPFTRDAVLRLRRAFGQALVSPAEKRQDPSSTGRATMVTLGSNGRFGNQLLQYAFVRCYGRVHNLRVEVPEWVGRWIFDLDDPYPTTELPTVNEEGDRLINSLAGISREVLAEHDLSGYFCGNTRHFAPHRDFIRALYQPGAHVRNALAEATDFVRGRGRTLVALHIRRGDFGYGPFWIAPEDWYLEWLRSLWPTLDRPVLYVASDDPNTVGRFAAYDPLCITDVPECVAGLDFLTDFHLLTQADCLAISNSTFSFVAAMLNQGARHFARPTSERRLSAFDPWNSDVLLPSEGHS